MERDLKVLIVGARYIVGGKFSTLVYLQDEDSYYFSSPQAIGSSKYKFQDVDHTPGLKNPIFDLNKIELTIQDYILEEGDWCKDFPQFVASRLFKTNKDLQFADKTYEAIKANLIFLFSGKTLHWDKNHEFAPELKTEYDHIEFDARYRNMLLIEPAESFL